MNVKKNRLTTILIILLLFISIGYAFLTGVLKINTSLSLNKVTFDIRFDNVTPESHNCDVVEDAHISDDKNREISFEVSLNHLKDYYKFTTDVINDSDVPVRIKTIELTGITDSQKKLISYRVYYTDSGEELKERDFVKPNTTTNITMEIEYYLDQSLEVSDLPTNNLSLDCMFTLTFESVDLNEFNSRKIVQVITKDVDFFPTDLIDFTKSTYSEEHEGLQLLDSTKDDEYPVYFYRGGNDKVHNHLIFANKCWRIIRTTDEGAIKIIYNGVPNENNQCLSTSEDDVQIGDKVYNQNKNWVWTSSELRIALNTWYFENLNKYNEYIYDTSYCNDNQYANGRIDLSCDDEHKLSVSNGKIDYPIALITAEEANLCGASINAATHLWLTTNKIFWTMTGRASNGRYVWWVSANGSMSDGGYGEGTKLSLGVRPVVALNKDVVINDGDGTASNPYIVALS